MKLSIREILNSTNANILQRGTVQEVAGVSIDTRTMKEGDLFIAIKGGHFDGHDFIEQAVEKGANGIVVAKLASPNCSCLTHQAKKWPDESGNYWILQVPDTTRALGDIANAWRKKVKCTVVAVTGSNGKSTTKEMIAAGLSETRKIVKTEGNFNNLIGLPLQVIRILPEHEIAVLEMGMNAPGEIKRLAEIAEPDVGLITNVNPAHLERLHTVEGVAKAKGELFDTMRGDGTIVINVEDPWAVRLGDSARQKKVTFGMQNGCDVQFGRLISEGLDKTELTFYTNGREYAMHLPLPGVHNVLNALSAVAAGIACGVKPITMLPGLERVTAMKMRMERVQLLNGVQVINDSYNANPSSMFAALRTVGAARRAGRFIAVLGDMLELGDAAKEKHLELGRNAVSFGVTRLFAVGNMATDVADGAIKEGLDKNNITAAGNADEIRKDVLKELKTGDVVLVKGSRGMRMELIVEFLKNEIGI